MTDSRTFTEQLKARARDWRAEIAALRAEAGALAGTAKARLDGQVRELEAQVQLAEAELDRAMARGEAEIEGMRETLAGAWDDISEGFARARDRLAG